MRGLQESIHFLGDGINSRPPEAAKLQLLRRAILDRTAVRFLYHTRFSADGRSRHRHRDADPYSLAHHSGAWYLAAYCHVRHGVRNFRLDRIDDLTVLDRTFLRPPNFQVQKRDLFEPGSFDVLLLFDGDIARWVRESPSFYTIAQEDTPHGLLVTLHIRHESEILQWLLGWGRHVRVLEPESLRRLIAQEARAMLAYAADDPAVEAPIPTRTQPATTNFERVESLLP